MGGEPGGVGEMKKKVKGLREMRKMYRLTKKIHDHRLRIDPVYKFNWKEK